MAVKEQGFNYGGDEDTQTTKYYYNQARMLEHVDGEENNRDLKFTYDSLGRTHRAMPPSRWQSRQPVLPGRPLDDPLTSLALLLITARSKQAVDC